ncbi:MAG: FAD-dependent tricarballylate dehydrogenase TcuA [Burkholderiales bacterium]|nr:FAD-dependent tricarballylate dehydrogenase TcuA [Burkholderiales bacterium]
MTATKHDVLVIGGGNAALCAALTAREAGASVLLLESAPREWRGGNSQHTRNLRCMHEAPQDVLTDAYPEEEYWQDLKKVTGGITNEALARMAIRYSSHCRNWMRKHGVHFQPALSGTMHLSRTNAFFMGGGKALVNAYYRSAEQMGAEIRYQAPVDRLELDNGRFKAACIGEERIEGRACVVASGGFESNLEWMREAWGQINGEWVADNFLIRGTRFNMGVLLKFLIENGADAIGDPTQSHCVAIDARAPLYDGGICTRVDSVSLGIVVNRHAQRFYDEGEDFWPKRYAIWGRLVAQQPGQIAYSVIDAKAIGRFMPPVFPGEKAQSLPELARQLGLDESAFVRTLEDYNSACRVGSFDHAVLDDCHTEGLAVPKTHWARPIDTPPFYAYALRPGITFTYLGVKVNEQAAVHFAGKPSSNLFAAGEIMAGNVLGKGYAGGVGMTIGTAFGRIAGAQAAAAAQGGATRAAA